MKLTKRKALEICAELWRWLEAHPSQVTKIGWPGWEKYGDMQSSCPCCEQADMKCTVCLLLSLWMQKDPEIDPSNCPCDVSSKSPYSRWAIAETPETRKKYAGIIADFAEKQLEKLK